MFAIKIITPAGVGLTGSATTREAVIETARAYISHYLALYPSVTIQVASTDPEEDSEADITDIRESKFLRILHVLEEHCAAYNLKDDDARLRCAAELAHALEGPS